MDIFPACVSNMKKSYIWTFIILVVGVILFTGCQSVSYQEIIETGVAGTQMAPATRTFTPPIPVPTETLVAVEPSPQITATLFVPTETPAPTETPIIYARIGEQTTCSNSLIAKVPSAPEFAKDLFEHHAFGTFLIIKLELVNITNQPIQIWDGDYSIESTVNGILKRVNPHRAATTYLFIQRGGNLMQDEVEPGVMNWQTNLAFDVDPMGENWVLVFKPGFEGGQALCELRFNLAASS